MNTKVLNELFLFANVCIMLDNIRDVNGLKHSVAVLVFNLNCSQIIDILLSKLICKGKKGTSELSLYAAADLVSSHVSNGFKHSVANLVFNRFIIDIL